MTDAFASEKTDPQVFVEMGEMVLLDLIARVEVQAYGPGVLIVAPRVLDHGPLVLAL